jgi:hypothetical protein
MLRFLKKWFAKEQDVEFAELDMPVVDMGIEELKKAIAQFAKEKPHGVLLRVLVKENNEIDYQLLKPYLRGLPKRSFYMSRELYEVFEEQVMACMVDQIQRAVDEYIQMEGKLPVIDYDPELKISYYKLQPYLKERPAFDTYLTPEENMISLKRKYLH